MQEVLHKSTKVILNIRQNLDSMKAQLVRHGAEAISQKTSGFQLYLNENSVH